MKDKCVIYIRVSTQKQGATHLGLDSQRKICKDFILANGCEFVREFMDVESGTHRDRKGLSDALSYCRENDCCLVIATLSRLARDVEFCFKVVNTGIEIHFVDMPQMSTLLLGVFASVAQYERELTSDRTKKALAAKVARGEKIGGASDAWRIAYNNKSYEQLIKEGMKRGKMKHNRHIANKDTQAFLKVIKNVFPDACTNENPAYWKWSKINTKGDAKDKIYHLMQSYKELDDNGVIFRRFDFTKPKEYIAGRIRTHLSNMKKSFGW